MEAGFETLETYIQQRQNVVAQYIATLLLLDLCKATERKQRAWVGIWWWEQAYIDLEGSREMAATVEEADNDGL